MKEIIILALTLLVSSSRVWAENDGDLKTYFNEKYGIELQYPAGFEVKEGKDDYWKFEYTTFKPLDRPAAGSITISYNGPQVGSYADNPPDKNFFSSFLTEEAYASPPPLVSLGKIKIGDVTGEHEVMTFGNGETHNITVHKNDIKFDIGATWGYVSDFGQPEPLPDYSKDKEIILQAFEQITSTIKFREPKNK